MPEPSRAERCEFITRSVCLGACVTSGRQWGRARALVTDAAAGAVAVAVAIAAKPMHASNWHFSTLYRFTDENHRIIIIIIITATILKVFFNEKLFLFVYIYVCGRVCVRARQPCMA